MPLVRYFFALQPDPAALTRFAQVSVPPGAAVVHPADLHLTLCFLGSLGDHDEATIVAATANALLGSAADRPVPILLDRLEAWRGPRVLCATGPSAGALGQLAEVVELAVASLGFEPAGRVFRSHVTLACRLPALPPGLSPLSPGIAWEGREVVLMASEPGAVPPRYRVRSRIPLSGA